MSLWLIRHPRPVTPAGICYGQLDVALPDNWQEQCNALMSSPFFLNANLTLCSSPLRRCQQLASLLSTTFNLPMECDDRLQEMSFGAWEGQSWESIADPHLDVWMRDYQNLRTTNGEGWLQLVDRVGDFLQETRDVWQSENQHLLLVTHAGVIRSVRHLLEQQSVTTLFAESVPYQTLLPVNVLRQ